MSAITCSILHITVCLNAGSVSQKVHPLQHRLDAGFDIADADLVVTGEGQLDEQSLQGKAVGGVAAHAHAAGVPVAAICGRVVLDGPKIQQLGLTHVIDASAGQALEHALAHAEGNYRQAARRLFGSLTRS